MGIKTSWFHTVTFNSIALKNLPTTWGLRPKPEVKPEPKEL